MTAQILQFPKRERRTPYTGKSYWLPISGTYVPPPAKQVPLAVAMRRTFVSSAAFWATLAWIIWS